MRDIKDAVVWVTGAGSGVGEAAAKLLASKGAAVVLTGRRREPLQAVATAIAPIFTERRPDLIYAPSFIDGHPDHRPPPGGTYPG